MIKFRCPHNGPKARRWKREKRLAERRKELDVPKSAKWQPVLDAGHEVKGVHQAVFKCPVCGAQIRVVTDQKVA